ncbi:hypothetical protein ACVXG7_23735 [Enterobacter hormaechei]
MKASNELAKSKARARGSTKPLTRKAFCRSTPIKRPGCDRQRAAAPGLGRPARVDQTHGLRNSTLSALMPSEPLRRSPTPLTVLSHRAGTSALKRRRRRAASGGTGLRTPAGCSYELLWEMPNNDGYLQLVGIMQKFIDQSISANTNYDRRASRPASTDAAAAERPADRLQIWRENAVLSQHP